MKVLIKDAKLNEVERLQAICDSWDDKELLEGSKFENDYIFNCITNGDLPPVKNAIKDNYRIKSIYLDETNELIGFYDMYYGYPTKDIAWISMFLIDKKYRGQGYASDVVEYIKEKSKSKGYRQLRLGVYSKNVRGIRFWTKVGFDRIFGIFGDKEYSENKFSIIGLEMEL